MHRSRWVLPGGSTTSGNSSPSLDRCPGCSVWSRFSRSRWDPLERGRPAALTFWYRQSPESLIPINPGLLIPGVTPANPPLVRAGMSLVRLDPEGRLLEFRAVPPAFRDPTIEPAAPAVDWSALFERADLDSLNEVRL